MISLTSLYRPHTLTRLPSYASWLVATCQLNGMTCILSATCGGLRALHIHACNQGILEMIITRMMTQDHVALRKALVALVALQALLLA